MPYRYKSFLRPLAMLAAISVSACASMVLPSEKSRDIYPWETFEEVQASYDAIVPYEAKISVLKEQGFDPEKINNISVLSYIDLMRRFSPILDKTDLPKGVQECIKAQDRCFAYSVTASNINRDRVGSVPLDLLGFRRQTSVSGWRFEAFFILIDDMIVYKLWSGTPSIKSHEDRIQPLGPAQGIGNLFNPFD